MPALRQLLVVAGDLDLNSGDPVVFDSYVEAAVHRFQLRHGLNADGVVRDATWRALNVPAQTRLSQLKTNAARLKSLSVNIGDRLVVANVSAAQIEAIENGGVYMHDTPSSNLFGEDFRLASPGCMRVQNVRELVSWILAESPGWSKVEIDTVVRSGESKNAKVARSLPLYWIYITAWATPDGVVQFRNDIYNRDGFGAQSNASRG